MVHKITQGCSTTKQNKTRNRSSTTTKSHFALITHASIKLTTFAEALKHKE